MANYVVLLDPSGYHCDLLLRVRRRDADGNVTSGFVINGAWNWQRKDGKEFARDGSRLVSSWEAGHRLTVEVPENVIKKFITRRFGTDYNSLIDWARNKHGQYRRAVSDLRT
jgi:hypothetical protein